jgi:hypothetical protein
MYIGRQRARRGGKSKKRIRETLKGSYVDRAEGGCRRCVRRWDKKGEFGGPKWLKECQEE